MRGVSDIRTSHTTAKACICGAGRLRCGGGLAFTASARHARFRLNVGIEGCPRLGQSLPGRVDACESLTIRSRGMSSNVPRSPTYALCWRPSRVARPSRWRGSKPKALTQFHIECRRGLDPRVIHSKLRMPCQMKTTAFMVSHMLSIEVVDALAYVNLAVPAARVVGRVPGRAAGDSRDAVTPGLSTKRARSKQFQR